jgi:hypothetical protein
MTTYPYTPTIAQDAMHEHKEIGFSITTPEGENYFVGEDWQLAVANDIADMFRYTRYLIHRDVTCHYLSQSKNQSTWADNGFSSLMIDGIAAHVLSLFKQTHDNIFFAGDSVKKPEEKDRTIGILLPLLMKEPEEGSDTQPPTTEDQTAYTRRAFREILIKHMEELADNPSELKDIALSKMPYASEEQINFAAFPISEIFGDIVTCAITAIDVCAGDASLFSPSPTTAFDAPDKEQIDIMRSIEALQYNFSAVHEILFTSAPTEAMSELEKTFLAAQEEQLQKIIGDIGVAMFPADPATTLPVYRAGEVLNDLFMVEQTFGVKTEPTTQTAYHAFEDWAQPVTPDALLSHELEVILQTVTHQITTGWMLPDVIYDVKTQGDNTLTESQQIELFESGPETWLTKEELEASDKAHATICTRLAKACSLMKANIWAASQYTKIVQDEPKRVLSVRSASRLPAPARLQ